MVAVILAGGVGARLKPLTITVPKPLLPLGQVPILEVVIRQLAASGFDRIILALGPMAPLFTASMGNGSQWGVAIEHCVEREPLGTAGPLSMAKDLGDHFLVMNGDLLTTLDYRALVAAHIDRGACATIAVSRRRVHVDYGVVETSAGGALLAYREKPEIPYQVSMGINVLSQACLEFISPGRKFDMPDLMAVLLKAGKLVQCYRTDCYWQDIGRLDDYQQASEDFMREPSRFLPDKGARWC